MYTEFFGLTCLPFSNTPDPRFFFKTPEHEEALARMQYCLAYHKGMLAVTGQAGTGKTLLTRLFLTSQAQAANVALVLHPQLSSEELLREVAREFGVNSMPSDSMSVVAARLQEFLIGQKQRGQNPLVIIDESHSIRGEAYDALRILSNLEVVDSKLVDIFLFGQPSLHRNLLNPDRHQLHQRLFSCVQLKNLTEEQTTGYILFRLQIAGAGEEPIFEPEAIRRIYEYSGGLPRLINQVCDNGLLTAFSAESKTVTSELAQEVIEQIIGIGGVDPASPLPGVVDGAGWNGGAVSTVDDGAARARMEAVLTFFGRKESELKSAVARMEERLSDVDTVMDRFGWLNDIDRLAALEQIEDQIQRIEASLADAAGMADRLADENTAAHAASEKLSETSEFRDRCTDEIRAAAEQSEHFLAGKAEEISDRAMHLLTELENRRVVVSEQADAVESKVKEAQATHEALEGSLSGMADRQSQAGQILADLADVSQRGENLVLTIRGNLEDVQAACDQSWSATHEAMRASEALAGVTAEAIDAHRNAQMIVEQLPDAQRLLEAMEAALTRGQEQIETLQASFARADEQILRSREENDRAEATFQNLYDAELRAKQTAEQMTQVTTEAIDVQQDVQALLDQVPGVQRTSEAMQSAQVRGAEQIKAQQEITNHAETQIARFAQESERAKEANQDLTRILGRTETAVRQAADVEQRLPNLIVEATELLKQLPKIEAALSTYAKIEEKLDKNIELLQTRLADAEDRLGALDDAAQRANDVGKWLDKMSEQSRITYGELDNGVHRAQQKDDELTAATRDAQSQCGQIEEHTRLAAEVRTKLTDDLQTIRRERTAIRDAVIASREVLRQVSDTDKILKTKLEANRAQQLEAHQQTAAIKKQLEEIRQEGNGLDQVSEKVEAIEAQIHETTGKVEQLDQTVETARSQIVAMLAEPDRILASIKSQIDRMMQVAEVSKKVHASISKASLTANRQLHSFRDLTSALDERMQKLSMADPMLDATLSPGPLLRNRLSAIARSNVIKYSASDRTPAFTRDEAGFIAETART